MTRVFGILTTDADVQRRFMATMRGDADEAAQLKQLWAETKRLHKTLGPRHRAAPAPDPAPAVERPERFAGIIAGFAAETLGKSQGKRFTHDPFRALRILNVPLRYQDNLHDETGQALYGRFLKPPFNLIQICSGLSPRVELETVCHELGHVLGVTEEHVDAFVRAFLKVPLPENRHAAWEALEQQAADREYIRAGVRLLGL